MGFFRYWWRVVLRAASDTLMLLEWKKHPSVLLLAAVALIGTFFAYQQTHGSEAAMSQLDWYLAYGGWLLKMALVLFLVNLFVVTPWRLHRDDQATIADLQGRLSELEERQQRKQLVQRIDAAFPLGKLKYGPHSATVEAYADMDEWFLMITWAQSFSDDKYFVALSPMNCTAHVVAKSARTTRIWFNTSLNLHHSEANVALGVEASGQPGADNSMNEPEFLTQDGTVWTVRSVQQYTRTNQDECNEMMHRLPDLAAWYSAHTEW